MKKKFKWFLGHSEYIVFLIALSVLIGMYFAGYFWEFDVIPPAKFVKICFAIIATSIGAGCTWIWMNVIPSLKKQIDPDTIDDVSIYEDKLTKWQKTQVAFWFYALYFFGFLWLVAF